MAQGMRAGISFLPLKICGKAAAKDVAAWMAGNATFPITSSSLKPKMDCALLYVTHFQIFTTVW